jgi:hypothetical protein
MKIFFTLVFVALVMLSFSQPSFAQSKKKDKKAKVSVHGEKDNDGKFNERKNKGQPKNKGKKSKKNVSLIQPSATTNFYVYFKRQDEIAESVYS